MTRSRRVGSSVRNEDEHEIGEQTTQDLLGHVQDALLNIWKNKEPRISVINGVHNSSQQTRTQIPESYNGKTI